jgi:hypothetical protein
VLPHHVLGPAVPGLVYVTLQLTVVAPRGACPEYVLGAKMAGV